MGVSQHNYIIIGANIKDHLSIDYDNDEEYEKYDKYRDSYSKQKQAGDMILLDDCYSGEYLYFGEVLQSDYEGYNGFYPFEVGIGVEGQTAKELMIKTRVQKFIREAFGVEVEPKIIVLTQYT